MHIAFPCTHCMHFTSVLLERRLKNGEYIWFNAVDCDYCGKGNTITIG